MTTLRRTIGAAVLAVIVTGLSGCYASYYDEDAYYRRSYPRYGYYYRDYPRYGYYYGDRYAYYDRRW